MVYTTSGERLDSVIDRYRTGDYGEELCAETILCSCCGNEISVGEAYFLVGETPYCLNCTDCAQSEILSRVSDDYLYVL